LVSWVKTLDHNLTCYLSG